MDLRLKAIHYLYCSFKDWISQYARNSTKNAGLIDLCAWLPDGQKIARRKARERTLSYATYPIFSPIISCISMSLSVKNVLASGEQADLN
jgi:hypothetical protein